ncbi:mitochondrial genome maintenance protein Mgm101p [Trichomonascus vanleenenianus]|uniref:Mgm101p n=1 Tax=Trichomonascus vanleenenianus TaxID=2268995 RepID=UPI003EC9A7B9
MGALAPLARSYATLGSTKAPFKPAATTANSATPAATTSSIVAQDDSYAVWKEFDDTPGELGASETAGENWAKSFAGLGVEPFPPQVVEILNADANPEDIEITPDGLIFLPEIKYRRILNKAFGPGGWGLAPRSPTVITPKTVSREYGLICHGRLVAVARGEQQYFNPDGVPTAIEGCKSNAMMRCCKDLGIASELWDPRFIRQFKKQHCDEKWFEKKRRFVWKRKDAPWEYPYK